MDAPRPVIDPGSLPADMAPRNNYTERSLDKSMWCCGMIESGCGSAPLLVLAVIAQCARTNTPMRLFPAIGPEVPREPASTKGFPSPVATFHAKEPDGTVVLAAAHESDGGVDTNVFDFCGAVKWSESVQSRPAKRSKPTTITTVRPAVAWTIP